MTNKNDDDDDDFGADMWLHVASDSLARYAGDGGQVEVQQADNGIVILLVDIRFDNEVLHDKFVQLFGSGQA